MKDFLSMNIKTLRAKNGVSQAQLGLELNKAHTSIGNWEKGYAQPSIAEIGAIASFFEVDPRDLIYTDLSEGKVIAETESTKNVQKGKVNGKGIGKVNAENDRTSDFGGEYNSGRGSGSANEQSSRIMGSILTELQADRKVLLEILQNVTRSASETSQIGQIRADVAEIKARLVV